MDIRNVTHFFTRQESALLGVCSELSRRLNLRPITVRLVFIALALLFTVAAVILYIGLYLAVVHRRNAAMRFGLIGALVGIPLSYYFQPDMVKHYDGQRGMFSYLRNFGNILDGYDRYVGNGWDILLNVLASVFVFAVIGGVIGYLLKRKGSLFLFPLVLIFAGCSSNDGVDELDAADFFFRFKVDGREQTYPFQEQFVNLRGIHGYDQHTGTHFVNIAGLRNIVEHETHSLSIFVSDTEGIAMGLNYSNIPGEGDGVPDFTFSMGYRGSDGGLYVAGGAGDNPMYGLYEAAFVEFSAITDTYISGTFSGTLTQYDNSNGINVLVGSVIISDGEFKVRR